MDFFSFIVFRSIAEFRHAALETMDPDRRAAVSIRLFDSPYKDIREWIWDNVEAIPPEIWIEAMRQALSAGVGLRQMGGLARQGILVVMQTLAYGYERLNFPLMLFTVIVLIIFVQIIQTIGNHYAAHSRGH